MSLFKHLLLKTVSNILDDDRVNTYKAPKLTTPEYGAAHRTLGTRVYKTFAVIHILHCLNFPDTVSSFADSKSWSKEERAAHLQKVVGKHRRRVR
jgi:hypothetical protein